jgi:hypothetical protein
MRLAPAIALLWLAMAPALAETAPLTDLMKAAAAREATERVSACTVAAVRELVVGNESEPARVIAESAVQRCHGPVQWLALVLYSLNSSRELSDYRRQLEAMLAKGLTGIVVQQRAANAQRPRPRPSRPQSTERSI